MNENNEKKVIDIENLSKIYKLYTKPNYKFLDMLGLLRDKSKIVEYTAINNISLKIYSGEKVGIIGRNGAGKSTLLKLISGVIEPTKGQIEVKGRARALLQIGSGFYPDFTGRENALAYLGQLGVSNDEAQKLLLDIIEFSELEDYIDQPLKTYSTGMGARLMFATSTAINPDLIILDEILSVGDAYFTHKSMDRIRDMCDKKNTTLLLVSHDIYSTAKLCDRMIWIDKGKILIDDEPIKTIKAYEQSVKLQEEQRIRKKSLLHLGKAKSDNKLIVELCSVDGNPLAAPVYVTSLLIKDNDKALVALPLFNELSDYAAAQLILEGSCWGDVQAFENQECRMIKNYGSLFHKASAYLTVNDLTGRLRNAELTLELQCAASVPLKLSVKIFHGEFHLCTTDVSIAPITWNTFSIDINNDNTTALEDISDDNYKIQGNGLFEINHFVITDKNGNALSQINYEDFINISIDYTIKEVDFSDSADIIIAIMKNGIETACRYFCDNLFFESKLSTFGRLQLQIPELLLGVGDYTITILIAKAGYNQQAFHKFYSISPDIYVFVRDIYAFKMLGEGLVNKGAPYIAKGVWDNLLTIKKKTNELEAMD